ncbi:MAG: hypothetical protein AAB397_03640 [Patescibacteria group bacterium]
MKKVLWIFGCVFLLGAPLTVKMLKKSWSEPIDKNDYVQNKTRLLSKKEKIFIYSYSYILGPLGLLIALMSQ